VIATLRKADMAGLTRQEAYHRRIGRFSMHQAANLQFERAVGEFARWRAVPEEKRSPAPAWWWGPAFEVLGMPLPMPAGWCTDLELSDGATYADGAKVFLGCLASQTSLPWPGEFPHRAGHSDAA
jgi:hypothetical protein